MRQRDRGRHRRSGRRHWRAPLQRSARSRKSARHSANAWSSLQPHSVHVQLERASTDVPPIPGGCRPRIELSGIFGNGTPHCERRMRSKRPIPLRRGGEVSCFFRQVARCSHSHRILSPPKHGLRRVARLPQSFCGNGVARSGSSTGDALASIRRAVFTGRIWRNRALGKKAFGGLGLLESDVGYARTTEAFNPGDAYSWQRYVSWSLRCSSRR